MKFPSLSLRNALTIPYVILTLVLAAVIALLSYSAGLKAVESLSSRLLADTVQRVSQAVERHLVGSVVALEAVLPHAEGVHSTSLPDFTELEKRMSMATALHFDPNNYVYYGNRQGQFIGVNRASDQLVEVRVKTDSTQPRQFFNVSKANTERKLTRAETAIYDPRIRPWYQVAAAQQKPIWTPVYVDFTTNELTTTRARPVFDASKEIEGVVATDVSLRKLSDFVKKLNLSEHGVAFLVEANGDLIATSSEEPLSRIEDGVKRRVSAADSKDELIRAAYAQFAPVIRTNSVIKTPFYTQFSTSIGTVGGAIDTVKDDAGLTWYALVALPHNDFMSDVIANTKRTVLVAILAALAALGVGLVVLNWLARDLRQLVLATKRIREGHVGESLAISRNDEIGELARSFEKMHIDLQVDELTGTFNRETFARLLDRRIREARASDSMSGSTAGGGAIFSVLFIDTDRFKSINDTHGHQVGDKVLQLVANRIRQSVRAGDVVARYGGDEFVVLLKDVGLLSTAKTVARKINETMAQPIPGHSLSLRSGATLEVSVSIGVSLFPVDGNSVDELIMVADRRMYQEKRAIAKIADADLG
jgi:diguanylate cyclase (GGDEF)-like protein